MPSVPFSSSEHKWYLHGKLEQPPEISQDGQTVTVTTVKGTDWWHVPDAWRSTGPIYGFDVDLPEKGVDLKVSVELDVAYKLEVCCGVGPRGLRLRADALLVAVVRSSTARLYLSAHALTSQRPSLPDHPLR